MQKGIREARTEERAIFFDAPAEKTVKRPNKFLGIDGDALPKLLRDNIFDRTVSFLRYVWDALGVRDAVDNFVYWNSFHSFRLIFKTFFKWKQYGGHNFPEYGPVLLIANHQSVLDPFFIAAAIPREVRWLSKIENFHMPVFKSILSFYGTFAVNRQENPAVAIEKIIDKLRKGEVVGMFPEGTRSPDGRLSPKFKTGAARVVIRTGVPYVPACILGSHEVLPKNNVNLKFAPVEIRVGEPVFVKHNDVRKLTKQMWWQVKGLMEGEIDPVNRLIITPKVPTELGDHAV